MANEVLEFVQRGRVAIVKRQYAEAVKICRLGLLGQPTLLEGRLVLGLALTALMRWDEVLVEMRVALETDPLSALAWLLKGEALFGKGDLVQAQSTLEQAQKLDPSNSKADELLARIRRARAAGFRSLPAEPTNTKEYPARAGDGRGEELTATGVLVEESTLIREGDTFTPSAGVHSAEETHPTRDSDEVSVEYEESTQVEVAALGDAEERTNTFHPKRARPADHAVFDHSDPPSFDGTIVPLTPHDEGDDDSANDEHTERTARAQLAAPREAAFVAEGVTDPSIPLGSHEIEIEPMSEVDPDYDLEDLSASSLHDELHEQLGGEEPKTHRRQRGADQLRDFAPTAGGPRAKPAYEPPVEFRAPLPLPAEDETAALGHRPNEARAKRAPPAEEFEARPTKRQPQKSPVPLPSLPARPNHASRDELVSTLFTGRLSRKDIALLATALLAVVGISVVAGLLYREWRTRGRVQIRHDMARRKLGSGNYPGFQAAEQLYRQILAERDDKSARGLRAKVLAQMAFEFGEDPQPAARALSGLSNEESDEVVEARIYLAMTMGEIDSAVRQASRYRKRRAVASADYLIGRVQLLAEQPEAAVEALHLAAAEDRENPIVLHGLGLAEAAARRYDRALDAFQQALSANANHIATIIDRALLQIRLANGPDSPVERDRAGAALEGVVGKLVADSSPGQLARAYVGLAELELQKGNVTSARGALAAAAAQRRDSDSLLLEELARAYADAFELDAAEREAQRALAGAARLPARLVLAQVALRRGRPAQALSVIEEAGSQHPEVFIIRALAKLQLQRTGEARGDAETALALAPESISARVALARVDIADGKLDGAERDLDRLERGPKSAEVAFALGQVFVARKIPERARFWFKEALRRTPLHLEARLSLARLLHDEGKLEDARVEIRQILAANASYSPARRELASLALDQGDAIAARDEYDALVDKDPDLDTFFGAARAHLQLGDGKGAEERLERAQKFAPIGAEAEEATCLLARAYLLEHRATDAATLLRKAVPTATRGETVALLMEAYLDLARLDWATQAIALAPPPARTGVELVVARARLQVESGKDPSAQAFAEEAIKQLRGPRSLPALKSEAYAVLGRALWEQGAFRGALKALKVATELDPRSARAFFYRGLVEEELKHLVEAREALETAVKNDGRFSDALYHLGRMRAEAGDPSAVDAYNQYLEVDPRGTFAEEARQGARGVRPTSSPLQNRRRVR